MSPLYRIGLQRKLLIRVCRCLFKVLTMTSESDRLRKTDLIFHNKSIKK